MHSILLSIVAIDLFSCTWMINSDCDLSNVLSASEGHYHYSMMFRWVLLNDAHICLVNRLKSVLVKSQKGTITIQWYSVENQKGAISNISDDPLRTRRALSLYTVYGSSAFLVVNKTLFNSDNALLSLNWQYCFSDSIFWDWKLYIRVSLTFLYETICILMVWKGNMFLKAWWSEGYNTK